VLADCAAGLTCLYDTPNCWYAGYCGPPGPFATLGCVPTGQACSDTSPPCCGGECRGGSCVPFTACGEAESACTVDLDCCAGFSCQSGTCTASCGQEYQPCQFQGDCCNEQGLECEIVGATSTTAECYPGNYYQPYDSSGQIPTLCGADCSGWECQLGAACSPYEALDPCAAVGLVCDEEFSVCRAPGPYVDWNTPLTAEECNPAGQACLPVPDSTVQPSCVYMPQYDAGFCLETCESNADCVDPYD